MPAKRVFLGLGSNLGNREENLENAIAALTRQGISLVARSSIYETEPQDVADQPWFLNMVIECETRYFPLQLLAVLLKIERELGRIRTNTVRKGPRIIDLDILLFGNFSMQTTQLTIPHSRMLDRRFILVPLLEIAPELKHPETKEPLKKALARLSGQRLRKK